MKIKTRLSFLKRKYKKELIPLPSMYWKAGSDPFVHTHDAEKRPMVDIFYATERERSYSSGNIVYSAGRDAELHLGKALVRLGPRKMTWEEIVQQTLEKKPDSVLSLSVLNVREIGDLWTVSSLGERDKKEKDLRKKQSMAFAEEINRKLRRSHRKDIYIFVPGFKVYFDDPILVARSLWHYLGYDGVFLAYSWPATPVHLAAYGHDVETTNYCSRNFRLLIEFLAQNTDARQIHLIGHSAGSRIVCNALKELRLINYTASEAMLRKTLKIGHVMLIGADFDRMMLRSYYRDNILDLVRKATIYVSRKDMVLSMVSILFGTPRLGDKVRRDLSDEALKVLRNNEKVCFVDVTNAQGAQEGSGHLYLLTSPAISSDMILTLRDGLSPSQRGLQPQENGLYWSWKRR
jgi:esterase/lipase superfamily enzyme